jgi:hypothetical protein
MSERCGLETQGSTPMTACLNCSVAGAYLADK